MTTFTYGDPLKPPPVDPPVAAATSKNPLGYGALKAKFIASLPLRSNSNGSLREAILGLHLLGVARNTLVRWAVDAGYTKSHSRSLISRLFRSLGLCVRKSGAGRKPDPAAVALLAGLRQEYGCIRARKLLRAALRADLADSRNRIEPMPRLLWYHN
jgi:hypothetical protein